MSSTTQSPEPRIVAAVFFEDERARAALDELAESGFDPAKIEVTARDLPMPAQNAPASEHPIAAGAAMGVVGGGVIGGVFGLLMGVGAALPEIGVIIGVATLTGVGLGIAAGGIIGIVIGVRVSRRGAGMTEDLYRDGILISVDTPDRQMDAKEVLIHHGGDLGPTNIAEAMNSESDRAAYLL